MIKRLGLALILAGLAICPNASGQVLSATAHCASGPATDVAFDAANSKLYVIDLLSGTVCVYNAGALLSEDASSPINHPFGAGVGLPPTPVARGLAFDSTNNQLVALARVGTVPPTVSFQIQAFDSTGSPIGSAVTVNDSDSDLYGLTYDSLNDLFWSRDNVADRLLGINPTTGNIDQEIAIPLGADEVIFGTGISHDVVGGEGFFDITYGNLLANTANRILRIDSTGARTGVDLDATSIDQIQGIARDGDSLFASSGTNFVFEVNLPNPDPIPPSEFIGRSLESGQVQLTWVNNGPGTSGGYDGIQIKRNGVLINTDASGDSTSFVDTPPDDVSSVQYTIEGIVANMGNQDVAPRTITVRVGPGSLVDFKQFAAAKPYGIAYDPAGDRIFVTEDSASSGMVFIYDTDLNLVDMFDTGFTRIRGVAYDFVRDIVHVSRQSSNTISRYDAVNGFAPLGSYGISGLGAGASDLRDLTYDSNIDAIVVIATQLGSRRFIAVDPDEMAICCDLAQPACQSNPVSCLGVTKSTATPPVITTLGSGIAKTPADANSVDGYWLATVESTPGVVPQSQQFFPTTGVNDTFILSFGVIGPSVQIAGAIRGIDDADNTLFVANSVTGTLFKLLLAAGGTDFIRGDANQDLNIDVSDATYLLNYLYAAGPAPDCLDAADVNDNGVIDLSDSLYLILHLFLSAPPPPAPYPDSGADPTFTDPFSC